MTENTKHVWDMGMLIVIIIFVIASAIIWEIGDNQQKNKLKEIELNYIVISGYNLTEIQLKVNAKMEQGYVPTGNISIGSNGWHQQAMMKNNEDYKE